MLDTLEAVRVSNSLPAMAAAIVTGKGIEESAVTGVRKLGSPDKVEPNDQFHLGSCTKAMTATLLAILVDEGKLTWQTTLAEALPGLRSTMCPEYRSVTIEQLLAHQSGFSSESRPHGMSFLAVHKLSRNPSKAREKYCKLILAEKPVHAPGSKFLYSNRNFALAGYIAERITGKPYEALMRERIFKPLGMSTAGFGSMGRPGRIEQPWQHVGTSPIEPGPLADNPPAIASAGTIHCSVNDWARFIQAHLQAGRGSKPLLPIRPATFSQLHSPYKDTDYGFGWLFTARPWAGGKCLTHAGSNNQNYAVVWMAPLKDFAVVVMTNQGGEQAAKACDQAASALIARHLEKH